MNKKTIIGCIAAAFLLLSTPMMSNMQAQQIKIAINEKENDGNRIFLNSVNSDKQTKPADIGNRIFFDRWISGYVYNSRGKEPREVCNGQDPMVMFFDDGVYVSEGAMKEGLLYKSLHLSVFLIIGITCASTGVTSPGDPLYFIAKADIILRVV